MNKKTIYKIFISLSAITILLTTFDFAQNIQQTKSKIKLARAKYNGGGDWYNDPSGDINLLNFVAKNTNIQVDPVYEYVDLASDNLFVYPLIYLTGHGNINFTDEEIKNLKSYLINGGFLYIDDDYGLDPFVRKEMKRVFPEQDFAELPFSHEIYNCHYKFPKGLPKIHEHDGKPPQGFGLFHNGKLCVFYTYESNIGDGWPDPEVHNDPGEKREEAFEMGTNIIVYALTH